VWALIAGLAHLVASVFPPGFYPSWHFGLSAIGYGPLRRSGAVLGTVAGASVVTLGLGAAGNPDLIPAALFVRGIWWWTIGKMWAETGVLTRPFGWITAALAMACFALVVAYSINEVSMSTPDLPLRVILGLWLIVLAGFLWRDAR